MLWPATLLHFGVALVISSSRTLSCAPEVCYLPYNLVRQFLPCRLLERVSPAAQGDLKLDNSLGVNAS